MKRQDGDQGRLLWRAGEIIARMESRALCIPASGFAKSFPAGWWGTMEC
jgi:hypothetical protein